MRTLWKVGLPGLVLLAVLACQLVPGQDASTELAGTSWVLSSLGGVAPLPGTTAWMSRLRSTLARMRRWTEIGTRKTVWAIPRLSAA